MSPKPGRRSPPWLETRARVVRVVLALAAIGSLFAFYAFVARDHKRHGTPRMAVLTPSAAEWRDNQALSFVTEELIAHLSVAFGPRLDIVAPLPGVDATRESVLARASYVLSLSSAEGPDQHGLVVRTWADEAILTTVV